MIVDLKGVLDVSTVFPLNIYICHVIFSAQTSQLGRKRSIGLMERQLTNIVVSPKFCEALSTQTVPSWISNAQFFVHRRTAS